MGRMLFACTLLSVSIAIPAHADAPAQPFIPPLDTIELPAMEQGRVLRGTQIPLPDPSPQGLSLARRVSLRQKMSPVKMQGSRGTCSVFATVALLEYGRSFRISEQCLAAHMGTGDPGKIPARLDWARHNQTYVERDCPYEAAPESASVLPNLRSAYKLVLRAQVDRQEFGWFSHEDPVAFIRKSLNEGKPVGASVIVAGNWWKISAPSPTRVRTELFERITVQLPPSIVASYPDNWIEGWPAPNPDGTLTRETCHWEEIDIMRAHRDPSHRELLRKYHFKDKTWPTGRYYDQASMEWRDRDFDTWFAQASRINVPSDDEVRQSCGKGQDSAAEKCGLHAIVFTGYDDETQTLEFKNSWGEDWKNEGYGFMSYAYYRRFHAAFSSESALVAITNLPSGRDPFFPVDF